MLQVIDRISAWTGKAVAWLVPVLILELVYDTAARYLFNAPTAWSYDISYMLYGTIFLAAAAYTLQLDRHVRIELLYDRLSTRGRAIIDCLGYLVFFFPPLTALVCYGAQFAWKSWGILETGGQSMWQPPIYPFKTVLPLAAALLLVQGVALFIRSLRIVVRGGGCDDRQP
ncbi:TRAP transporter small permease subunit [Desulfovermiculus halophilus]|uniref:TRAP transporter small permease subunit n=1 Tax=Desulfovermiculus halophilus TaxID=339722 RepID=UPI00068871CA|nr:TRAP transporter small permease subunit [Desulfovermiculus halophilus]